MRTTHTKPLVYVAGASYEPNRALAAAEVLRDMGVEVDHPWWEQVLAIGHQNDTKDTQSAMDWAQGDLMAVMRADAVLLLAAAPGAVISAGAHVEMGVALAHGIPVIVAGAGSIFYALAREVFSSDLAACMGAAKIALESHAAIPVLVPS